MYIIPQHFAIFSYKVHTNAAQSLCDIVRIGREQMSQLQDKAESDPLLVTVEW